MNFSQRMGLEPATKPIQSASMDGDLRSSLWNAFDQAILRRIRVDWERHGNATQQGLSKNLFLPLWMSFFKWSLSTLNGAGEFDMKTVHDWFFSPKTPWNKKYEFVEFIANLEGDLQQAASFFVMLCNRMLEREFSAYRFVGTTLTAITNEAEIKAIEQAASMDNCLLRPVSMHIDAALKLIADKKQPDYRNSMKESISAVEAICKIIAKNDKATLGPALDIVAGKTKLHARLQDGFKAIYGYTSDTHGIRHGLKDDAEPEHEDALFMLVSCSAFVNYLVEKSRKLGLLPT